MSHEKKTVATPDGPMKVHVISPKKAQGKPFPALLVLQEAFGVNHHILNVCRRLADNGYVALAPELFHRFGDGIEVEYTEFAKSRPMMAELTNDRLVDDMRAALQLARDLPQVDKEKIGAIGFCMGGFAAMLGACRLPLTAAVSFYGGGIVHRRPGIGFSPLLDEFAGVKCPVFLGWGALDQGIPLQDVEVVRKTLVGLSKDSTSKIYPDSNHGFMCDERSSYNPQTAELAWSDALAWLRAHLR
ncbi:MAG: dienelactone hydrolase family protein [Bacillota bacterium]